MMKKRLPSFLVPVLTAVVILYQLLTDLQIALAHGATLTVVGVTLGIAALAGLLAAYGPAVVRVGVLAFCTLVFLDVTLHLSDVFERLKPATRVLVTRDEQRIADVQKIKAALEQYIAKVGPLPAPIDYGEDTGPVGFWARSWDVSSRDGDGDKLPFLGFLVDAEILPAVPVDPINEPSSDPRLGKQYVYFIQPPGSDYEGGTCDPKPNRWHYLVAVTDLEGETTRPTKRFAGSGCPCLWKNVPDFFGKQFDYVLCGTYEATPEAIARAAETRVKLADARAKKIADALAAKKAAELRKFVPQDHRRVADLQKIQKALQAYIANVGPLPAARDYGEAENSTNTGFWSKYWDVSTQDGDRDGRPFLDFLVESGTLPSVPVDPENIASPDGSPTGGRQYVYFVVPPEESYAGGTCTAGTKKWVYMLGITDLRSEVTRPPKSIPGSSCNCLWRDLPNFYQQNFDYVLCGTYEATPESIARAKAFLEKRAADELAEKQAHALRNFIPEDLRRVAALKRIQTALENHIEKTGSLPMPREYGESEKSQNAGFFQYDWDVSAEDGDGDGKPFLDFLAESGTMPSVPVDPENVRAPDGDPRGGRQFVYYVVPPDNTYAGGSCGRPNKRWVYMLGITDLRSELVRPPKRIPGSGCDCLFREYPNFFQPNFDYVVCGTFRR